MKLTRSIYNSIEDIRAEVQGLKTCVILGTGASINNLDFNKVGEFLTIGINRIGRAFTPDIHINIDATTWDSNSPAKLTWDGSGAADNYIRYGRHCAGIPYALRLAIEFGIINIYLCGIDLNGFHFWDPKGNHATLEGYEKYWIHLKRIHLESIIQAAKALKIKGGGLYNCSRSSFIDFLEYSDRFNEAN